MADYHDDTTCGPNYSRLDGYEANRCTSQLTKFYLFIIF